MSVVPLVIDTLLLVGFSAFYLLATVIFISAVIIALWSFGCACLKHPKGLLRYGRSTLPRFALIAGVTFAIAVITTKDGPPIEYAAALCLIMYGWIWMLFSNIEAPTYETPDEYRSANV